MRERPARQGTARSPTAENAILLGPSGVGKTHLGIGLGIKAVQAGHRVLFDTATGWVTRLRAAHDEARLPAELHRLHRYQLLIIDEIGYIPFDADAANLFFQLISSRYEQGSVLATSNMPFSRWGEIFGDDVVAAAMIDRLVHHAEVLTPSTREARASTRTSRTRPTTGPVGSPAGLELVLLCDRAHLIHRHRGQGRHQGRAPRRLGDRQQVAPPSTDHVAEHPRSPGMRQSAHHPDPDAERVELTPQHTQRLEDVRRGHVPRPLRPRQGETPVTTDTGQDQRPGLLPTIEDNRNRTLFIHPRTARPVHTVAVTAAVTCSRPHAHHGDKGPVTWTFRSAPDASLREPVGVVAGDPLSVRAVRSRRRGGA